MLLSASFVKGVTVPGKYSDGLGLYLTVKERGKSWTFRYSFGGQRREIGLGGAGGITLSAARAEAQRYYQLCKAGKDPHKIRHERILADCLASSRAVELRQVVAEYVEIRASSWSGARQRAQWLASFENHVYRYTDGVPVSEIDTQTVTRILRPLWGEKRETARRVRMRLERVLGYAKTQRYRSGDNPAAWKDNLDLAFTESDTTKHLRAVPFADVPALYRRIAQIESVPAYALRLQILTVPRTDGLRKARKTEFDLASGVWVIPKERTKTRRSDHRIPLSAEAIRVVEKAARVAEGEYLFPGSYYGRPLSDMACIMVMRRMGRDEVPHGFRSTFKDWASECTEHPNIVSEMALGHAVGNKVEAAYRRGDLFEKRISLMNDWAGYCTSQLILHNVSIPFETT